MGDDLTNLNYDRPVFKLIDDLRRERSMAAKIGEAGVAKLPIGRAIGVVRKSTSASQDRELVHQCALKVLEHVALHRDLRVVVHFLEVIVDSKSKRALVDWFTAHSPVAFTPTGEVRFDKAKPMKRGEGALSPYWKFYAKPVKKALDPIVELERTLRLLKRNEANRDETSISSRFIIADLEALIRKHG